MVKRFILKVNEEIIEYRTLEGACQKIKALEKLDYKCELWLRTTGLYFEHTYLIYSTIQRTELKKQVKSFGLLV